MNADGSGLRAVVEGGGTNTYPSWSPDGSALLFTSTRNGQPNLYRVDLATGDITPLTALNVAHQGAYSPDGSKIVYVGDEGVWRLYVLDVGTNEAQALDDGVYAQRPAWTADGEQIVYTSFRDGQAELYVIGVNGDGRHALTENPARDEAPSVAADSRIAFTSDRDGYAGLYVTSADEAVERLAPGLWASHPAWSPDGEAIAFAGNSAPVVERLMEAQMDEPPPCPTDAPATRVVCYQYDALGRLTEAKDWQTGALTRFYQYAYDLRSNRTSAALDGVSTQYTYDPVNRLTTILPGGQPSISLTYDPNGNLTSDGTLTYIYDAANRLRAVNDSMLEQLLDYDALGNRVRQTLTQPGQPTLTTDYLLDIRTDLSHILRETTTGGPSTDDTWYMLGLDIIGQQQNGAWSYFGYDGLGSVRHLTDEYGTVTARMSYDPYGVPLQTNTASSLGFTGELTDPTGLIYLRARTYNPALGIFTSRDPVLGIAGLSASYNGYGYVHGNPVNYRDPSGECAFLPALAWLAMTIFGGTVVGATTAVAYDVFANQGMGLGGYNQGNYGAIDWTRAKAAAQFGAGLGFEISTNAGLGVLTGGGLSALVKAGKLSTGAAWGLGALADIGVGTLSDAMLHGDDAGDALINNAVFFGAGEIIGAVARQAVRGVSRAIRGGASAIDRALSRAGRWYAETFDLGAATTGGLPILRKSIGSAENTVTVYRVHAVPPGESRIVTGGAFRRLREQGIPLSEAFSRRQRLLNALESSDANTLRRALHDAQASGLKNPFISTTFSRERAMEAYLAALRQGRNVELLTIVGPRTGGVDFEEVFGLLGGRTKRFQDALLVEFGIIDLFIPERGPNASGFYVIRRE